MIIGIDTSEAVSVPTSQLSRTRFESSAAVDPLAALPRVDRVELSDDVPPPELCAEIELASRRAAELASHRRELHFAKDEDSGRIIVQVRDLEGNVIRTIPGSEALDVLSGAELLQPMANLVVDEAFGLRITEVVSGLATMG